MHPDTHITYASPDDPLLKRQLIRSIERLSGQRRIERIYYSITADHRAENFFAAALNQLDINVAYAQSQLDQIPATGPLVIVANHPFGVLDGLIICQLAARVRPDFKILINSLLCQVDEIAPHILPVDFAETEAALKTNIQTKREALKTVKAGGAVVVFPAGGISTSKKAFGRATDLEWKLFPAKLIKQAEATVVPIFFHGQNSRIFQLASHISLTLRLSLIMREVRRQMGSTIQVSIGMPLPYSQLAHFEKKRALLDHLRETTYALGRPEAAERHQEKLLLRLVQSGKEQLESRLTNKV